MVEVKIPTVFSKIILIPVTHKYIQFCSEYINIIFRKKIRIKCHLEKMSLGQNVTRKKCHQEKSLVEKMSLGRNVLGKNVVGKNVIRKKRLITTNSICKCHESICLFIICLQLFVYALFITQANCVSLHLFQSYVGTQFIQVFST